MGGGALSSDYVSKLGSKEVSKKLRNFIPRPYDGRGCHEVTGEGFNKKNGVKTVLF